MVSTDVLSDITLLCRLISEYGGLKTGRLVLAALLLLAALAVLLTALAVLLAALARTTHLLAYSTHCLGHLVLQRQVIFCVADCNQKETRLRSEAE